MTMNTEAQAPPAPEPGRSSPRCILECIQDITPLEAGAVTTPRLSSMLLLALLRRPIRSYSICCGPGYVAVIQFPFDSQRNVLNLRNI